MQPKTKTNANTIQKWPTKISAQNVKCFNINVQGNWELPMDFEFGFNRNWDSTIQMSKNRCRKPKMVQEKKMCKARKGKNENSAQNVKCFNINVTQGVENENLNN